MSNIKPYPYEKAVRNKKVPAIPVPKILVAGIKVEEMNETLVDIINELIEKTSNRKLIKYKMVVTLAKSYYNLSCEQLSNLGNIYKAEGYTINVINDRNHFTVDARW